MGTRQQKERKHQRERTTNRGGNRRFITPSEDSQRNLLLISNVPPLYYMEKKEGCATKWDSAAQKKLYSFVKKTFLNWDESLSYVGEREKFGVLVCVTPARVDGSNHKKVRKMPLGEIRRTFMQD